MPGKKDKITDSNISILIIDEDKAVHKTISSWFPDLDIYCVFSAAEALEILVKQSIFIVISSLSINKSIETGLLQSIKNTQGMVQFIMTIEDEKCEDILYALDIGADDILLKPVQKKLGKEVLNSTISKIIRWKTILKKIIQ